LQNGSSGRLAVAAKHFPGQGNLDDASLTIDRSLDDLKKIDLPPFERLLPAPIEKGRPLADALLTTSVRYRGFSGNIRERTAPISVDGNALKTLLDLELLKAWRDNGGLLVSDAPGSAAVRDYYAMTANAPISVTQIALDAFQAGNDVLVLDHLVGETRNDAPRIREVIDAFRQKYSTDPAFQQRVDSAVQRILRLKYRLYRDFDFNAVIATPASEAATAPIDGAATAAGVAADANTLLWPPADKLTAASPQPEDFFLIATDTRLIRPCPSCPVEQTLGENDLAQAISRAYNVPTQNISTTTFVDLKAFVTGAPDAPDLTPAFNNANWVVLAMQSLDSAYQASDAAQLLLDQRRDLLTDKRVIGFMFGPPYGLTLQQMAGFTALYALYGKLAPNIEVAVQSLTSEQVPQGRSPVNLPALAYDLTTQTEPDPNQVIALAVGEEAVPGQPTPVPVTLQVGSTARLRAGPILDRNGHPVPDGTPVKFYFQYDGDAAPKVQDAMTINGVARTEFVLDKVGRLLIRATSEPALNSIGLQITIGESGSAVIATVAPTPTPTVTRIPTVTPTVTATPTATPTPLPGPVEAFFTRKPQNAQWGELILALIGVTALAGGGYWAARQQRDDLSGALHVALWAAIGGLLGYVYFSLDLPGSELLRSAMGGWAALLMTLLGGAVPLLFWLREARRASR
jgi:beta-N-acetylhexosaminidase